MFILYRIRVANCMKFKARAKQINNKELMAVCMEYMRRNFTHIAETRDFLDMNIEDLTEILRDDHLGPNITEDDVLDAGISWLKHHQEDADHVANIHQVFTVGSP